MNKFLCAGLCAASILLSGGALADDATAQAHVSVNVVEVVEIHTPVEYAPVCQPDNINEFCRHSWDDMHPPAKLNQIEPSTGGDTDADNQPDR